jgi:hypothetical protein
MDSLDKIISEQRDYIEGLLVGRLGQVADLCAACWNDREQLDVQLKSFLTSHPEHRCTLLYAINSEGYQCSSNISDMGIDSMRYGQDLSHRPYLDLQRDFREKVITLSDVYIDKQNRKPCITALHRVSIGEQTLGYVAADFGINDLPLKHVDQPLLCSWLQIKGDPSIRGTLFQQMRTRSAMDEQLEEVLDVVESLVTEQGIFHAKLHFSSSRATLWPYNDPHRYRLHVLDEIINPRVCLVYSKTPYPEDALIPASLVPSILDMFKVLREADETIYLRAASLNIMNGLVGLNFSCDGSHYMPAEEFLSKDRKFWFS